MLIKKSTSRQFVAPRLLALKPAYCKALWLIWVKREATFPCSL
ncbi:Uncharacterized protein PPKH_0910 [Pseudomonas putida]|nr:Uncharacterized protein PPKH_0910 [Pseudomonas putida]